MYIKKDTLKENNTDLLFTQIQFNVLSFLVEETLDNIKQLSRRLGKEQIKQQLTDSLGFNENTDKEELNMRADRVKDCQEALNIIKECEDIIKTNRKNIICFAYQ